MESNGVNVQKDEHAMENPAIELLKWIRKSNLYEDIPLVVDQFVHEYGKYKKDNHMEVADQATEMMKKLAFENVRDLHEEVLIRMTKLENRGFWHFIPKPLSTIFKSVASNIKKINFPSNESIAHPLLATNDIEYNMEVENDMVIVNTSDTSRHDQNGAQQLVSFENQDSYENFVTSSGKSPRLNKLIRSCFCKLLFLTKNFTMVMEAADKLDRVVFGGFHLSLYSQNFWQLCEYWSTCPNISDENSFAFQDFKQVVETVEGAYCRDNLYEINRNVDLVKKLKSLTKLLNDDFYRLVTVSYVCKIFDRFPLSYDELSEKMYLEWVKDCCEILHYINLNDRYTGVHSVYIKNSIDRLRVILGKMNFLALA